METKPNLYTVYGKRWFILALYFLISVIIQIQWLTFAPVARAAQVAYGATAMQIDFLSLVFMLVFLVASIPASHVIDRHGIRIGIGIGAVLTGIFGLMKGLFGTSYLLVLIAQIGLGIAQPFILNAVTRLAAHWFPINERATAVGIGTLAQFLGMILVMLITPYLVPENGTLADMKNMLMIYGIISAASAALLVLFLKDRPPTPPGPEHEEDQISMWEGMRRLLGNRDMRWTIVLFFIGLGMFNAIATCIDQIAKEKGFTMEQSGEIMGMMLFTGIIGAVILPPISDKLRKRKPFLILSMLLLIPGIAGLALLKDIALVMASAGVIGFFLLGAGAPVGFQYSAEVSYPIPESLSQGVILWAGQLSGILFIVGMNLTTDRGIPIVYSLFMFLGLAVLNLIIAMILRESPRILTASGE